MEIINALYLSVANTARLRADTVLNAPTGANAPTLKRTGDLL